MIAECLPESPCAAAGGHVSSCGDPAGARPTRVRPSSRLPAYLARLYDAPLLTPDQEKAAFNLYNNLRDRLAEAETHQQSAIARVLAAQAQTVRDAIVTANLRLVVALVKKHWQRGTGEFFELVSEGNIALLRAVEKFDVNYGVKFSTYATTAIRRHLQHWRRREQSQQARFISNPDAATVCDESGDSSDIVQFRAEQDVLRLLKRLTPREQSLLSARFGLAAGSTGRSFTDLGQEMGISKERARQLAVRALGKLRTWVEQEHVEVPAGLI